MWTILRTENITNKMDGGMIFAEYMTLKTRHRLVILPGLRVPTVTPALAYTEWCKSDLTLDAPQNGRVEPLIPRCLYYYILAQKSLETRRVCNRKTTSYDFCVKLYFSQTRKETARSSN